jgi:phosphatidylserine decarboxylase
MTRVGIDPAGYPFIAGALVLAAVAGVFGGWLYAIVPLVFAGFFLFFFRDPERAVTVRPDAVLSPADGRVMVAGAADPAAAPPGEWLQISIFLSPMDVHINRVPASGRVTNVSYRPGKYLAAYRHDAASVNERSEIWIQHNGQFVVARQIVGLLARRVVCRLKPGADVKAGDRYGVMKFGSRMDVFVPTTAEICVQPGTMVRGGETVIAMLHSTAATE